MSVAPLITAQPALSRSDWKRLNRLLAQALEVDADARAGWITSLPDSDRDLLPVLEQLLDRAESTEAMAATRAGPGLGSDSLRPEDTTTGSAPVEEQPGSQVGPYRLLREIGRGGMGTVWLAERVDGVIQRQVALKLPRAEWTDRGLADRMARERSALASLNHPNIAQLYDAGWAADGRPYLALEYVEGEAIDAWCRRQQLTTVDRVRLFVDAVRAVSFAHAKLVIHRDLKPSNVLVTSEGRIKLLDFGIAKLLTADAALAEETALTRFSGRALTLSYAAPEQVLGQPISTAVDTYSLGVMLYELLSGKRPYVPTRESRGALEEAIVNTDPPAPSSVAEKAAGRALRGDLDTIILKALRKRPEQRYETAAAFADDLERWLDGRPVRAQRSSGWYRARRFVARHRLRFAVGAMATLALLVGGSVILWQRHVAGEDAARAGSVRNFVLAIIAQADPSASGVTRDTDLALLTTAESRLTAELATNPELALELRLAIAQAYQNRGEFERARATLRGAIDEARRTLPPDDLNLMRASVRNAGWQNSRHNPDDQAVRELDAAIDRTRLLGRPGAQILVEGLTARAALRGRLNRVEEMRADMREAYEAAVRHFGAGDPIALGAAHEMAWRFKVSESLPVIESSYRAANANPNLDLAHPKRLQLQSAYGVLLCLSGRGREGLELLRASESIARKHHGSSLPTELALAALRVGLELAGDARGSLAVAKEALELASAREPGSSNQRGREGMLVFSAIAARRIDEALPLVREAEARLATMSEHPLHGRGTVYLNWHKVWVMNLAGDTVGAEDLAERNIALAEAQGMGEPARGIRLARSYALRMNGKALEAERLLADLPDPRLGDFDEDADFFSESAAVRLAAGDPQAALDLSDRALAAFRRIRLQVDPALSDLHATRGQALLALKRPAEARDAFRIADDFRRSYDADSHWSAEASYWLARALIETGDAATGKPMLKAARARLAKSPMPLHRRLAAAADAVQQEPR